MLKRVRITGFKSLKDVEVELEPLTVVMGPNAAGKSNFFDALYLLQNLVTKENVFKAFGEKGDAAIRSFYYADEGLDKLIKKDEVNCTFEIDVVLSENVVKHIEAKIAKLKEERGIETTKKHIFYKELRYKVVLTLKPKTASVFVKEESLAPLTKNLKRERVRPKPFIDTENNYISLRQERVGPPRKIEKWLDYTIASTPLYLPHYPHVNAFREELSQWAFYYLDPKKTMRAETLVKNVSKIGPTGEDLAAFYGTLQSGKDNFIYKNIVSAITATIPEIDDVVVFLTRDGRAELFVKEGPNYYSAHQISEGTLRILGLFAILFSETPSTLIGYEEPENGIHPDRLIYVSKMLKNFVKYTGKQLLINTHSPLLSEEFESENLYECRKVGGETIISHTITPYPLLKQEDIKKALKD